MHRLRKQCALKDKPQTELLRRVVLCVREPSLLRVTCYRSESATERDIDVTACANKEVCYEHNGLARAGHTLKHIQGRERTAKQHETQMHDRLDEKSSPRSESADESDISKLSKLLRMC